MDKWLAADQIALNKELDKLAKLEERIEKYQGKLPYDHRYDLVSERKFKQKMEEFKKKNDNTTKS